MHDSDLVSSLNLSDLMDELEAQSAVIINFHDLSGLSLQIPSLKIRQEQHYHHGHYCAFAKRNGNLSACASNKERSKQRAQAGNSFSGYCPYGIWDYALPLRLDEKIIGIVYAGSLQGQRQLAAIGGKQYHGPALATLTPERKQICKDAAAFLARYIFLLIGAWTRQGNLLGKKKSEHFYLQAMQQYIETHYHRPISLQAFAEQLHVHANYIGALISKMTGSSFRQHLLAYRCKQAQIFLLGSNDSITKIAFACGFQDSNYFSSAFKRHCGLSPRQFRQTKKN